MPKWEEPLMLSLKGAIGRRRSRFRGQWVTLGGGGGLMHTSAEKPGAQDDPLGRVRASLTGLFSQRGEIRAPSLARRQPRQE